MSSAQCPLTLFLEGRLLFAPAANSWRQEADHQRISAAGKKESGKRRGEVKLVLHSIWPTGRSIRCASELASSFGTQLVRAHLVLLILFGLGSIFSPRVVHYQWP